MFESVGGRSDGRTDLAPVPSLKLTFRKYYSNQSRTNGPINAHLTIAQVIPKYNDNNEKLEALL